MNASPKKLLRTFVVLTLGFAPASPLHALDRPGSGGDLYWSTKENWSGSTVPASSSNIVFTATASKTTRTSPSNIVGSDQAIRSLVFENLGAGVNDWQTTQINTGATLTLTGGSSASVFRVGDSQTTLQRTTQVAFTGAGSLVIDQASGSINISNNGDNSLTGTSVSELDLSQLASFSANVNDINIGGPTKSRAILTLATHNTITANNLYVAARGTGVPAPGEEASQLYLGQTNVLNIGTLHIAASFGSSPQKASAEIRFLSQTNDSSVTIRGVGGGTTRSHLLIGSSAAGSGSTANPQATADFRGGTIDALLETLLIGSGNNNGNDGSMTGTLSMDRGVIDAVTTTVGQSITGGAAGAATATGNLNIEGGEFRTGSLTIAANQAAAQKVSGNVTISGGKLQVSGGVIMGQRNGTAAAVNAAIDITGGTLEVEGGIAQGSQNAAVNTSLRLAGGTLDMKGGSVTVNTFHLEKGTLRNLGEFNTGAALVKTGNHDDQLIIEGINDYTGLTDVQGGSVLLTGTLSGTSGVVVRSGASLGGNGSVQGDVVIQDGGWLTSEAGGTPLQTGALSLESGATLALRLGEAGNGAIQAFGEVNLDQSHLVLSLDFRPEENQTFTLLSNHSGLAITGLFATVNGTEFAPGHQFTLNYDSNDYRFELLYHGIEGGANDLALRVIAIPEPSTTALLLLLAGTGVYWRHQCSARRRQNRQATFNGP